MHVSGALAELVVAEYFALVSYQLVHAGSLDWTEGDIATCFASYLAGPRFVDKARCQQVQHAASLSYRHLVHFLRFQDGSQRGVDSPLWLLSSHVRERFPSRACESEVFL